MGARCRHTRGHGDTRLDPESVLHAAVPQVTPDVVSGHSSPVLWTVVGEFGGCSTAGRAQGFGPGPVHPCMSGSGSTSAPSTSCRRGVTSEPPGGTPSSRPTHGWNRGVTARHTPFLSRGRAGYVDRYPPSLSLSGGRPGDRCRDPGRVGTSCRPGAPTGPESVPLPTDVDPLCAPPDSGFSAP